MFFVSSCTCTLLAGAITNGHILSGTFCQAPMFAVLLLLEHGAMDTPCSIMVQHAMLSWYALLGHGSGVLWSAQTSACVTIIDNSLYINASR